MVPSLPALAPLSCTSILCLRCLGSHREDPRGEIYSPSLVFLALLHSSLVLTTKVCAVWSGLGYLEYAITMRKADLRNSLIPG